MRRYLTVLALCLLLPMFGSAQSIEYKGAGGVSELTSSGTALTSTVPILLPDGSAAAPALAFATNQDFGFSQSSTDVLALSSSGALNTTWLRFASTGYDTMYAADPRSSVQNGGLYMVATGTVTWASSSTNNASGRDLILTREAAATLQMGQDAATATAQTIKGSDSTGSGTAGGSLTLKGGAGTSGNADGGNLVLAGGALAGSGEYGAVTISDLGTKPTCDAGIRGAFWYDAGGAGVADTFEVCRKDAGDAYAWVSVY